MSVKIPFHVIPHKITPGDTFYSLAKHYNTTVDAICLANPEIDPNFLQVGQNIYIPVSKPVAIANIRGGPLGPQIQGVVAFYKIRGGTWICVEVNGLPPYQPAANGQNPIGPHGFHIHEFGSCNVGNPEIPFKEQGDTGIPQISPTETMPAICLCCFQITAMPECAFSQMPLHLMM